MEVKIGSYAKSKTGHDSNKIYVIISCDGEYVYLVDGRIRTLERPKKKKLKHIQLINQTDVVIGEKLQQNKLLINEDIKKAIKNYTAGN